MKTLLKLLCVFVSGATVGAVPLVGSYWLWAWCLAQVPAAWEWAGIIKVAITLGMIATGGWWVVCLAVAGGVIVAGGVGVLLFE